MIRGGETPDALVDLLVSGVTERRANEVFGVRHVGPGEERAAREHGDAPRARTDHRRVSKSNGAIATRELRLPMVMTISGFSGPGFFGEFAEPELRF